MRSPLIAVVFGVVFLTLAFAAPVTVPFSNEDRAEVNKLISDYVKERTKQCGANWQNWQSTYATFHNAELAKEKDKRILVAVPNLSGLADRIIGATTAFMIAVLTNRAFQFGRRKEIPILEQAFQPAHFNWTRAQDEDWLIEPLKHKASHKNYNETVIQSRKYFAVNTLDDYRLQDRLLRGNLVELMGGADIETTFMVINRGKTIRMFENQNHVKQLTEMGLTPATAFGCLTYHLLQPKAEIFAPLLPQLRSLRSSDKILRIGIQIRSGDKMMMNPHHQIDAGEYSAFFSCAEQIEAFALKDGKYEKAMWFLVTDIKSLRESVVKKYGENKVVTSLQVNIEHSSKETSVCRDCDPVSLHGFTGAAAEWYMLSMTDYFVISRYSGFGRSAGMMSMRQNSIYTVINGKEKADITCSSQSFTDLENISYDWSGI